MSILYRLPEKVKKRLCQKALPAEPAQTDPFLDWSVRCITTRFACDFSFEYILLINGATHYVSLFKNPGFSSFEELGRLAAQSLRAQFLSFALRDLYNERIAPHVQDFRFARACDPRATACATTIANQAVYLLEQDYSIEDTCFKLNNTFLKTQMKGNGEYYTPDQYMVSLFESQKSRS